MNNSTSGHIVSDRTINKLSSWIMTTHIFALYPIILFLWSWKMRKEPEAIHMLIKYIFCVTFSILYHSYYTYNSRITSHEDFLNWGVLDAYTSTSLIFSTTLYCLRVRSPQFYITSYGVETTILMLYLFHRIWFLTTWFLLLSCGITSIFKWRTLVRYCKKYYYISFLTFILGISSTSCYLAAINFFYDDVVYIKYHSLWHCFIFLTAGTGCILRYKLDEELYPIRRREQLDSI